MLVGWGKRWIDNIGGPGIYLLEPGGYFYLRPGGKFY